MDRRRFVSAGALGAAATLAGCGPGPGQGRRTTREGGGEAPGVITRPRVRWRLASSFPRSTEILYGGAELLASRVSALSEGRFVIETFEGGALVPALQVLDAVQGGSVQIGHTAGYYYLGKNPALAFETAVPFGMQARQHDAWMREGGGLELTRATLADFGILNFLGGNTGTQMGGWFREPVRSLDDLKALTMRIPGLGARVMEQLGVIPQTIPGGEIYGALERGAIDATEWIGPYDDETMGLFQIAKTYHYPGWWEPQASLAFYVNQSAYDRLPSGYQQILATATDEVNARMVSQYDARNPAALARLIEAGVQTVPFPDDVMQAAARTSRDLIEDTAQQADAHYRDLLTSYQSFKTASDRWFSTAEQTMAAFASRSVRRSAS